MSDSKEKSSNARKISSKAPPQIVNFFSNPSTSDDVPTSSSDPLHSKDRKRKLTENNLAPENENALTLAKKAEKISKIPKTKRVGTLVSTFFQQEKNDGLSDFESPERRVQIKSPPVLAKKKVNRKRKQTGKQKADKDALETEIFEKVLIHHSTVDGINSDDLQMALALSRSLVDSGDPSEDIANIIRTADPSRKEDIVRHTFQRFGFKKRDNKDYDYRDFFTNVATNKKWFSKFTALTRRSENMQKEKFTKKVKAILLTSESFDDVDGETMQVYHPTSEYLHQFFVPKSPTYNISLAATDAKIKDFYSNNLVPISTLRCGSLLKNWSDIPGRDFSPERDHFVSTQCEALILSPNALDATKSVDNLGESSSCGFFETNQKEDVNPGPSLHVDDVDVPNVDEINAKLLVDLTKNTEIPNFGDSKEPTKFHDDNKPSEAVYMTYNESANTASENCNQCCINTTTVATLSVDKTTRKRVREASPDMFADYDTSANNSFNDYDTSTTNILIDQSVSVTDLRSKLVDEDDEMISAITPKEPVVNRLSSTKNDITSTNVPQDQNPLIEQMDATGNANVDNDIAHYSNSPIDLDSSASEELEFDPEPDLRSLAQSSKENYGKEDSQAMDDKRCENLIPISQQNLNGVVLLSSESSNQSSVNAFEPRAETSQKKLSSIVSHNKEIDLSLKSVVVNKRLSFTERLELYNSDPALDNSDEDPISCRMTESSQDSIVISDDEINYSMAGGGVQSPLTMSQMNIQTQESIEISDTEDFEPEIQLPEYDIEKRESVPSINLSNNDDCVSEKSLDINFDDQMFNSQSLTDEDLINLSIKEICQKEFVAGSSKPSTSKKFSRTISDMTFERKVRNTPKSPDQIIQLSDDESDEFDLLVKGHRSLPKTPEKSTKFVDEDFDKLVKGNICDDVNVLGSSASPTECHEFIVQSMDQIYEVKTGILVSPKPDYENMDSPTRLEHLKKYGLKTLSKRKAVICLEHIYNRLHPFIELDGPDNLIDVLSQKEVRANGSDKRFVDGSSQPTKLPSFTANKPRNNGYNVNNIDHNITENNFDILQENEVIYLPSAPRAKKPWCLQPLHIAWHNLLNSNPALQAHILQYKPIDLLDIRLLFKSIDLRYEANDIISFLDRKCITFKTENNRNTAVKKTI